MKNNSPVDHSPASFDPEVELQRTENWADTSRIFLLTMWAIFQFVRLANLIACPCEKLHRWFTLHRVCGWCHKHLGGNRRARQTSHGICPACEGKMIDAEVFNH